MGGIASFIGGGTGGMPFGADDAGVPYGIGGGVDGTAGTGGMPFGADGTAGGASFIGGSGGGSLPGIMF